MTEKAAAGKVKAALYFAMGRTDPPYEISDTETAISERDAVESATRWSPSSAIAFDSKSRLVYRISCHSLKTDAGDENKCTQSENKLALILNTFLKIYESVIS